MGLNFYEALRQEDLAEVLAGRLATESREGGVLSQSCVVVQNTGLGRWLRLWHASYCGISAGIRMPFPRSLMTEILEQTGEFQRKNALEVDRMHWILFHLLSERCFQHWGTTGRPLQSYLKPDNPNLEKRCWQLSGQVAALFDSYAIFRPEWMLEWIGNTESSSGKLMAHWDWQRALLRDLRAFLGLDIDQMTQVIFGLALDRFCTEKVESLNLRTPIHVFGVSSFSPAYLKFFLRLSEVCDVTMYHLVSSEVFLGDLPKSYRRALIEMGHYDNSNLEVPEMFDNPLLIANAQSSARFQSLLLALNFPTGDHPQPTDLKNESDLSALQISLRANLPATQFKGDGTVSIHSCHSATREVQILQQQLLSLFAQDDSLRPEEILVLTPDINEYAEAVDAVFSVGTRVSGSDTPTKIPYSIADRKTSEEQGSHLFLDVLLELLSGRQTFSQVVRLLDFDPVLEHLGVSSEEVEALVSLLQEVGIRWGVDAETRRSQGLPEYDAYSWHYGLERLFDGLIYPEREQINAAPQGVGRRTAEIIGAFTAMLKPIFLFIQTRDRFLEFKAWVNELMGLLLDCLGDTEEGNRWMYILSLYLSRIQNGATDVRISFSVFCEIVSAGQSNDSGLSGLLRKGVTFCRLQPVRHIPARVICILGMNEGAYPRQQSSSEFDLIASQKRSARELRGSSLAYREVHYLGDHSQRDEDRQLFLDCLLNAREHLYISYVGQSDKSNEPMPPSVLIRELIQFFQFQNPKAGVCIEHPLQEWSTENFKYPQAEAGKFPVPIHFDTSLAGPRIPKKETRPFLSTADRLVQSSESNTIQVDELMRFLSDPAKYYLKRRMRVHLDQMDWLDIPDDWEAMALDGLDRWKLRQCVFDLFIEQRTIYKNNVEKASRSIREKLERNLTLPAGLVGVKIWNHEVKPLLVSLYGAINSNQLSNRTSKRLVGDVYVSHHFWELEDGCQFIVLNGSFKAKYAFEAYLKHSLMGQESLIFSLVEGDIYKIPALNETETADALAWLGNLVSYWKGSCNNPLPFSFEIGIGYVESLLKESDIPLNKHEALTKAYLDGWERFGGGGDYSESQMLCFDSDSPAGPESRWRDVYMDTSEIILSPFLVWMDRLKQGGIQ